MNKMTYQDADRAVDALVHQQKNNQALARLLKMREEFPDHIYDSTEYIVHVYLLLERPNDAVAELAGALDRGHFYPLEWEYFKERIGHLPEYPDLLKKSLELKEQFQQEAELKWETHPPTSSDSGPFPVIVFLHGNGQNIETIKSYWPPDPFLELGYLVVYIQPHQVTKYNGYSWTEDYSLSRGQVSQVLDTGKNEYEIDPGNINLAGFSGGAMLALDMVLRKTISVSKCIALGPADGPYLDEVSDWDLGHLDDRITLLYGDMEFLDQENLVLKKLDENGVPYNLEICPDIGHWYPTDIVERTIDILTED
jgi:predicted esterase